MATVNDSLKKRNQGMTARLAHLISGIFSPFLIGLFFILLVSLEMSASLLGAIKWSLLLITLSILPTFIFTVFLVRHNRLDGIFSSHHRQRTRIYALMLVLAGICGFILFILKAPLMLLALAVAGFSGTVMFMFINLWWKISLHTAFVTAMVVILFIFYGFMSTASVVLIPLVAWARIKLENHSLAQTVTGALLGTVVLVTVFYLFGLV